MIRKRALAWAAGAAAGMLSSGASADGFDGYGDSYRAFQTPPVGSGSFGVAGAALADGRLLMATGNSLFVESGPGTAEFAEVARLDAAATGGSIDPAFLTISPGGTRIAVGGGFGKPVAVFALDALGTPDAPTDLISGETAEYFKVGHYDGAWYDEVSLALTAGDFGTPAFVSLLDTTSDPDAPARRTVVSGIRGASSGVAFDREGRLYTGNGFADGGGSDTGWIRAFDAAEWIGGVDFESGGVLIGDVLSAGSLEFDSFGNLAVGGGDFGGQDAGYMGLIHAAAIADALAGLGAIDGADPAELKRLDPRGDGLGYFGAAYNGATGELYATDGTTWYATVPSPGCAAAIGVGALLAGRRRHG
ncbi:MAG TPA: hypothetical protein VFF69_06825 [Phycisphaerales bacterium]|nr:hypothetical protein [Phycisphaerales bacterium]